MLGDLFPCPRCHDLPGRRTRTAVSDTGRETYEWVCLECGLIVVYHYVAKPREQALLCDLKRVKPFYLARLRKRAGWNDATDEHQTRRPGD